MVKETCMYCIWAEFDALTGTCKKHRKEINLESEICESYSLFMRVKSVQGKVEDKDE